MKLTELARKTLEHYFAGKEFVPNAKTKERYKEKKASFVTLTNGGDLRGCVGSLVAHRQLWKDVQENTINAAFRDTRFSPLKKEELKRIKIEISVLTVPKPLKYKNEGDLLKKINKSMGVILQKGNYSATFLPQVWEDIINKVEFLEYLSLKAGLSEDAWKSAQFWYYKVKKEKE